MDVNSLIEKYYNNNKEAKDYLMIHGTVVAEMALNIAKKSTLLKIDKDFVYEAALIHDIGIVYCYAPEIGCVGEEPYIRHGMIGYDMLMAEGLPRHARVCLSHVGVGLTVEEIVNARLPLKAMDMLPNTIEEKLVCLADKFYSKTPEYLTHPKPINVVLEQISRFGETNKNRFIDLCKLFQISL